MSETETETIDGVDYEVIAVQEDGGGDYQWGMAALVRDPTGHLFLVSDGGCSCYGPWDNPELTSVSSWQDAVEKVKTDYPPEFNDDDVAQFAEKLMALRPAPSVP